VTQAEVEEIMRTRNVVENLNALEDLIADAKRRRARAIDNQDPPTPFGSPTPLNSFDTGMLTIKSRPHLLPTAAILSAHLAPQLASSQSQLNARLQTLQSQNAALFQTIEAQKKELASLVNGLELYVKDIEGAVDGLNGNVDTLRQDVRDADTEMAGL
jgi:kinetochore protein NNF1